MTEPSVQIFAASAQEYDAWFDRHRLVYESEIQALKRFIGSGGIGLEIGVGTGRFAVPLGIEVGVEPGAAMADMAQKRGLKVYRAMAAALPFRPDSFDLVMMVTVICFLRDPFLALTEATRVLKPGGRFIIGTIDRDSPLGRSYEAHKHESRFYRHANFYSISQVLKWLEKLTYRKIEVCQTLFCQLSDLTHLDPVRQGHGDGGFVVIAAQKPEGT
jgi:ubiquinone/menaquinone biosynthesis C-methylase UbiE